MKKQRILYIDILKIVSFLGIVLLHSTAYYVTAVQHDSKVFLSITVLNSLTRFAVPCFIMITGALLLNERKILTKQSFIKHYLLRIIAITAFWTFFYAAIFIIFYNEDTLSIKLILDCLLNYKGVDCFHLWYLYFLIGAYLMLPVLKLFVKKSNRKYILYLIIVLMLFEFVPQLLDTYFHYSLTSFSAISNKFSIFVCIGLSIYLLIGWYLNEFSTSRKFRIIIYVLGVVSLIAQISSIYSLIDINSSITNNVLTPSSIYSLLTGTAMFLFCQQLFKNKNSSKIIKSIGKVSLGSYAIHVFYLQIFQRAFSCFATDDVSILVHVIAMFIVCSILSILTAWLLSKIPGVRILVST